ncbi:MAG TPA: DedA family protein [Burkholderiales bacterium]|nr:DedA family protein [Burkholderiales bacterium]
MVKRIDLGSDAARWIAIAVFAAAALSSALFGLRTYGSFRLLRSAYEAGVPMTSSIRPWMRLDYVSATYHASERALVERLGLSSKTDPHTSLRTLAQREGQSLLEYVQRVQRAIVGIAPARRSDGASKESSWLGRIADKCLAAVLIYGYPALALTILLGSIGLPVPVGFVTTVAGSLAAEGRMDWAWAAAITLVASVLGDAVAYALGRVLGRGVLERHGRWFGYTPERTVRVKLLFERWGFWSVLITRTFVSYLSAVVSVLAGAGRYRLPEFLALTVLGRIAWTSAYLGLGYGVGTDLQAATDLLKNLSGLLLSLAVLAGSGWVGFGHASMLSRPKVPAKTP